MKASVLIVVYNETLSNIACLEAVRNAKQVSQIVVCDNSTVENDNADEAERLGISYISMCGNVGLPKAYNAGVKACTGDVICIFDDDTAIEPGYFEELEHRWNSDDYWDILLPLVIADNRVLSPCRFNGYKAHAFNDVSQITDSDSLSGINSGMAIRRAVFDKVLYNESQFLDLVDHRFIRDARNVGFTVKFNGAMRLFQRFSLTTDNCESALNRLAIFARDAKVFYSATFSQQIYYALMLSYRRLRLCKRYKDLRFLTIRATRKAD